jgi:hypothetical protein
MRFSAGLERSLALRPYADATASTLPSKNLSPSVHSPSTEPHGKVAPRPSGWSSQMTNRRKGGVGSGQRWVAQALFFGLNGKPHAALGSYRRYLSFGAFFLKALGVGPPRSPHHPLVRTGHQDGELMEEEPLIQKNPRRSRISAELAHFLAISRAYTIGKPL